MEGQGESDLIFRAITTRGERRGIRLERIFWDALSDAAVARGITLSALVAETAERMEGNNLASALRVTGTAYLRRSLDTTRSLASSARTFLVLNACPTPCFVISAKQEIVNCNRPFVSFVNESFNGTSDSENLIRRLALALDIEPDTAMQRLRGSDALNTGFNLDLEDRRLRGNARLVAAPVVDRDMLIAFLLPSRTVGSSS